MGLMELHTRVSFHSMIEGEVAFMYVREFCRPICDPSQFQVRVMIQFRHGRRFACLSIRPRREPLTRATAPPSI
jgi:hypothetical protein